MFDCYWYDYDLSYNISHLIKQAQASSRTEYVWLLHKSVDYKNFNLRFLPNRHQKNFFHAWPSHDNLECFTTWLIPTDLKYETSQKVFYDYTLPVLNPPEWITDPNIDYSNFNFNWFPSVWDWELNHEFAMSGKKQLSYTKLKHNGNGTKYYISDLQFDKKYYEICCIDTNTHELPEFDFKVRLITTMEETLKAAVSKATKPWLWVISDCCEYTDFDFSWLPDKDQEHYIHCWPSGNCEKGDTFLINVAAFMNNQRDFNFDHEPIKRKPWPNIRITHDSLAQELNATTRLNSIYTIYSYGGYKDYPDVCLWEKRPVVSLNHSNSTCLVPRDCIVKKEIYEYPYLLNQTSYGFDIFTDVIFIHNNESCAQENWEKCKVLRPDAKLLSGVDGRLKAYKNAALLSDTPWFIAVFAKCKMLENFKDFNWQPDFWQEPKHYIFYNHNKNNNLIYGHMAPIAYNKKLMLENAGGLDMTLAQMHTTVPICISETYIENDPWLTWRTSFREVIKLIHYSKQNSSVENEFRLWSWKNVTNGSDSIWQKRGVNDAYDFYNNVNGKEDLLLETIEWNWLKEYFNNLYKDEITV